MSSYHESIPPGIADDINAKLDALASTSARLQGAVAATQSEHRVEDPVWQEFFDLIHSTEIDELHAAIRDWARSRTRLGPRSQWFRPLVRAVTRTAFIDAVRAQKTAHGAFLTARAVREIVDNLTDEHRWQVGQQKAVDLGIDIGRFTIWATFSSTPQAFAGLPSSATGVARELGWDDGITRGVYYKGARPIFLLEYNPSDENILFPTMIEAWASDPLNYYFQPAPAGAPHGRTRPWANSPEGTLPRPEVVHSPYSMAALIRSVKVLR